jgi:hypothetical protein
MRMAIPPTAASDPLLVPVGGLCHTVVVVMFPLVVVPGMVVVVGITMIVVAVGGFVVVVSTWVVVVPKMVVFSGGRVVVVAGIVVVSHRTVVGVAVVVVWHSQLWAYAPVDRPTTEIRATSGIRANSFLIVGLPDVLVRFVGGR